MKITLDPSLFKTSTIPEDDYDMVAISMKKVTSKAGNQAGLFMFEVKSQGSDPDFKTVGRRVMGNITATEDSLWKGNQLYHAATGEDMPAKDFESWDEYLDWLFEQVNGIPIRVRVKHRINPQTGDVNADLTYLKP